MITDVAIVQTKPRKGDVSANMSRMREAFATLVRAGRPDLIVFPEAAMTGYFLEGAVYELAVTPQTFADRLDGAYRAAGGTAPVDVIAGFYENDNGTYYNSAICATLGVARADSNAQSNGSHRRNMPAIDLREESDRRANERRLGERRVVERRALPRESDNNDRRTMERRFGDRRMELDRRADRGRAVVKHVHRKMFLPTYGVFDESRFLSRGRRLDIVQTAFGPTAILVCEDAWHSIMPTIAAIKGARAIVVPSASPGRGIAGDGNGSLQSVAHWRALLSTFASEHGVYVLYAGLTGFEGGKGMSGGSCIISPRGEIVAQADETSETILRATLDDVEVNLARATMPLLGDLMAVLPDLLLDPSLPITPPRAVTPPMFRTSEE